MARQDLGTENCCNKKQASLLKPDILTVANRIVSISKPFLLEKADFLGLILITRHHCTLGMGDRQWHLFGCICTHSCTAHEAGPQGPGPGDAEVVQNPGKDRCGLICHPWERVNILEDRRKEATMSAGKEPMSSHWAWFIWLLGSITISQSSWQLCVGTELWGLLFGSSRSRSLSHQGV